MVKKGHSIQPWIISSYLTYIIFTKVRYKQIYIYIYVILYLVCRLWTSEIMDFDVLLLGTVSPLRMKIDNATLKI